MRSVFDPTDDPELDALTITATQMYLVDGEHADLSKDQEEIHSCPLTNIACESTMGFLDREISIQPNATPSYLDASIGVRTNTPDSIGEVGDTEKE